MKPTFRKLTVVLILLLGSAFFLWRTTRQTPASATHVASKPAARPSPPSAKKAVPDAPKVTMRKRDVAGNPTGETVTAQIPEMKLAAPIPTPEDGRPKEVRDMGDYYTLADGRKIPLHRVLDEVALKLKGQSVDADKAWEEFQQKRAAQGEVALVRRGPSGGEAGVTIMSAPGIGNDLAGLSANEDVAGAYPVFVNPENGMRVITPPEILIGLNEGTSIDSVRSALAGLGMTPVAQVGPPELAIHKLRYEPQNGQIDVFAATRQVAAVAGVRNAEPDFMQELTAQDSSTRPNPNDPLFIRQTNLDNDGNNAGTGTTTTNADVRGPSAWNQLLGSRLGDIIGTAWAAGQHYTVGQLVNSGGRIYRVTFEGDSAAPAPTHTSGPALNGSAELTAAGRTPVVAVLDTGVDLTHPDLNIFTNTAEIAGNSTDDDGNGYVDDVRGWNFVGNNATPADDGNHGTAVAGTASARQNTLGASGIAPGVAVLPVKTTEASGSTTLNSTLLNAFAYAGQFADVINFSHGTATATSFFDATIATLSAPTATRRGRMVFAATGNSASRWRSQLVRISNWPDGSAVSLTAGQAYYLAFRYIKNDDTLTAGNDQAMIDDVCIMNGTGSTVIAAGLGGNGIERFEGGLPAGWNGDWAFFTGWNATTTRAFTASGGATSLVSAAVGEGQSAGVFTPQLTGNGNITIAFQARVDSHSADVLQVALYRQDFVNGSFVLTPINGGQLAGTGAVAELTGMAYPAASSNLAIAVGSSTDYDRRSQFSQFPSTTGGKQLDFLAPGGGGLFDISTTDRQGNVGYNTATTANGGDYAAVSGTSFATPTAAGISAMVLSRYPGLTREDVLDIMRGTCDQVAGASYTNSGRALEYGFGRLNASSALSRAGTVPVINAPTPTSVVTGASLAISGTHFYGNANPAQAGGQSLFATLTPSGGGTSTNLPLTKTLTPNGTTGLNDIQLAATVPSGLATGSYNLVVTSPAGASLGYAISVQSPEIEVAQPVGTVIADGGSVSFGAASVGATTSQLTFTVSNVGVGNLTGVSITKDGAHASDFSVSAPSSTVAAGTSTTFTVTFAPSAAGVRTAAIHIASNDGDESPYDISLSGTGQVQVAAVNSSTANGVYKAPLVIPITVAFGAPVTVTGTPTLALNSGGTATYASGSGGSVLTFNYTVTTAHNTADLDYTSTSALALSGGTISDSSGAAAILTLPAPGAAGSLGFNKNLVIDNIAPVATITPSGTYMRTAILFTITFSDPVVNMTTADVTITGGTKGTFTAIAGGTTYTVAVTSPVQGTVTCTLANGAANDSVGNPTAGTSASIIYDTVVPTIAISSPSPTLANSSGTVQYTVTYSDLHFNASTLTPANITPTGTAASGVVVGVSGTGTTRTVTLSNLNVNGTLGISIAAGTASDLAGNVTAAKASTVNATIDNNAPVVTASTALLAASANSVAIAGSGFSATPANNTVTFDNGAAGTVTAATATSLTVTFSTKPQVAGPLTAVVTDLVGNSSIPKVIRTVKPVVTANTTSIEASETSIIINGFGFDYDWSNTSVTFSGAATGTYTPSFASPTSLTIENIPNLMPGTLSAVVTSNGVSSGTAVQVATVTLPEGMAGRYAGVVDRHPTVNGSHGGIIDMTIAANGTVTGTVTFAAQSVPFSGSVAHNGDFTINRTLTETAISGYTTRDSLVMELTWYGWGGFYGSVGDGDFKELTVTTAVSQPLSNPRGIAAASDGTLYIAETDRHHILKVDPAGTVTVFAGITDTAGNADGAPGTGTLSSPCGLALDGTTLWVADSGNGSVRQISTSTGSISSTSGITGLLQPVGVVVNSTTVFVLEKGGHRIKRRPKAGGTVTLLAGSSTGVPGSTATTFKSPEGLAINPAGTLLFVADTGNHCIRKVTIPGTGAGTITVWAGAFNSPANIGGLPTVARFNAPTAVTVDANGGVWVADTGNQALKLIASSGITAEHSDGYWSEWGDLRCLTIGPDGGILAGEQDVGVRKSQEGTAPMLATVNDVTHKASGLLPASARINSYIGAGGSYDWRPDGSIVQWGAGYASFNTVKSSTATDCTYSMAGRLPDGTAITASGIINADWYLPVSSVYTVSGSTWQASFHGVPAWSTTWDPNGGADIQWIAGDSYVLKTPEPAATAGASQLDGGIPEWWADVWGFEYRSLAFYNQSLGLDPATIPNAIFYAETYTDVPYDFYVDQPVRFTNSAIGVPAPNDNSLSLSVTATTGIVTGSFTPPGAAAATLNMMLVPFMGGYGYYLMGGVQNGPTSFW